jgi:GxxExxY protein
MVKKAILKMDIKLKMDINNLSGCVIGAAIEVHKALGPGLLESAYEECLSYELTNRGVSYERQKSVPVTYKGRHLDCAYRVDLVIENIMILELKAISAVEPIHKAQILTYLKLMDLNLGFIFNFNTILMKDGIYRIVNNLREDCRCNFALESATECSAPSASQR